MGLALLTAAEPVGVMDVVNRWAALAFGRPLAVADATRPAENKVTGETYAVTGDESAVEAVEFGGEFAQRKPAAGKLAGDSLTARYEDGAMNVVQEG